MILGNLNVSSPLKKFRKLTSEMEKICELNELHYSDYSEGKNSDDGDVMGWTDSKRVIPKLVTGIDLYMQSSG